MNRIFRLLRQRHYRKFLAKLDSERLQAIFMTDEILDLPKTIRMVAELPGLRACLLNTTDGLKLAGNLEDPSQEQAISALVPELFQQARSKLASMHLGRLETITLYCGRNQLSTFLQGKYLFNRSPRQPSIQTGRTGKGPSGDERACDTEQV